MASVLGRKQRSSNDEFLRVAREIEAHITRTEIEALEVTTLREMEAFASRLSSPNIGYGWSGGKDSIALGEICRRAGVTNCVLGLTRLEYPAFLAWVTDHMPNGLTVINTGQDLAWLEAHPEMLFPQTANVAAKWFAQVQHRAQREYFQRQGLRALYLGRRRQDGNFVGKNGQNWYEKDGVLRYSPLSEWTHEQVIAFNHYARLPIPPIYFWPNGFVVGTGPWAARQYTGSIENGWREVFSIDPSVVETAATRLESAQTFLRQR